MSIGEHARVELMPVQQADASTIFEAWGCHPENFTNLTARVFAEVSDARAYIAGLFQTPGSKAFHIRVPGGPIVGLVKAAVLGHRAQVGYVVHRPFCGCGYATDAVRQIVAALEEMPAISRIWATCALDNSASARVLEKNNFVREAILKRWVIYPAQGQEAFDNYSYVRLPGAVE